MLLGYIMLWFNISLVILLASIPLLLVIYMTNGFRITWVRAVVLMAYSIAAYSAFKGYAFAAGLNMIAFLLWAYREDME